MSTMPANRIDFIDENNAWGGFLSLLEHVTNSRGAHTDKHLDKIRTADAEEWDICFTGDGPSKKGFASSWRPNHQDALWNTPAQFLEFLRIFQEIDDLLHFLFGLLNTGNILKRHAIPIASKHSSFALAEIECAFPGVPNLLPEKEVKNQEKQRYRQKLNQRRQHDIGIGFDVYLVTAILQLRLQVLVVLNENCGLEVVWCTSQRRWFLALFVRPTQCLRRAPFSHDQLERLLFADPTFINVFLEIGKTDLFDVSVVTVPGQQKPA